MLTSTNIIPSHTFLLGAYDITTFQQSNKLPITNTACSACMVVAEFVSSDKHKPTGLSATPLGVIMELYVLVFCLYICLLVCWVSQWKLPHRIDIVRLMVLNAQWQIAARTHPSVQCSGLEGVSPPPIMSGQLDTNNISWKGYSCKGRYLRLAKIRGEGVQYSCDWKSDDYSHMLVGQSTINRFGCYCLLRLMCMPSTIFGYFF